MRVYLADAELGSFVLCVSVLCVRPSYLTRPRGRCHGRFLCRTRMIVTGCDDDPYPHHRHVYIPFHAAHPLPPRRADFFQLPPVCKPGQVKPFCFETAAWAKVVRHCVELKQVFRQNDSAFIRLLNRVRWGVCTAEMAHILRTESGADFERADGIEPTTLNTHKADVAQRNQQKLDELRSDKVVLVAHDTGEPQLLAQARAGGRVMHDTVAGAVAECIMDGTNNSEFTPRVIHSQHRVQVFPGRVCAIFLPCLKKYDKYALNHQLFHAPSI